MNESIFHSKDLNVYKILVLFLITGILLSSCELLDKEDQDDLESTATTNQYRMDCRGCHNYPVADVHHQYHLFSLNVKDHTTGEPKFNGKVACTDCHFTSMKVHQEMVYDSLWVDQFGNTSNTPDSLSALAAVDSFLNYNPILQYPEDPDSILPIWQTTGTHHNGTLDIVFAPNNLVDTLSADTAWSLEKQTCSMIACHNSQSAYRWANPQKGLTGLPLPEVSE